jgi:hypothetical protein
MKSQRPNDRVVQPFNRPGSWYVSDGFRDQAHFCLLQVEAHDAETDRYFSELEADPLHRRRKTPPADFPNALVFFSNSAIVSAAMAVEEFLNYYGVVRLGESFYQYNLERMAPVQKVATLLGICCGALVGGDDEIIQVTKRLFERRNALVHPKTRESGSDGRSAGDGASPHQKLAHDSVIEMEKFARLFQRYDPDAADFGR